MRRRPCVVPGCKTLPSCPHHKPWQRTAPAWRRRRLLQFVHAEPGLSSVTIAKQLDVSESAVRDGLQALEQGGKVVPLALDDRTRLWFGT